MHKSESWYAESVLNPHIDVHFLTWFGTLSVSWLWLRDAISPGFLLCIGLYFIRITFCSLLLIYMRTRYVALFAWTLAVWVSFNPLIDKRSVTETAEEVSTLAKLLFAFMLCAGILLFEKFSIQWIAGKFHERSYAGMQNLLNELA